jgi:hypothetical protein
MPASTWYQAESFPPTSALPTEMLRRGHCCLARRLHLRSGGLVAIRGYRPFPISVYAAASDGRLSKIQGSQFEQPTGVMVGNNHLLDGNSRQGNLAPSTVSSL